MKLGLKGREIHYPILLFVSTIGMSLTRGVENNLLHSVGRNGIWLFFPCLALALLGAWFGMKAVRRTQAGSIMTAGPAWFAPVGCLLYGLLFTGGSAYALLLSGDFYSRTLLYGDQKMLMTIGPILAAVTAMFNIETLARNAHLMMLFIMPVFLLVSLLPIKVARWSFLYPPLDLPDWDDPLLGIAAIMTMFIPLGAVTMLMTRMKEPKAFGSLTVLMLICALFGSYMYAMGIATQGLEGAKRLSFLAHGTYGAIRVENFVFERIMFMAMLLWEYLYVVSTALLTRCAVFCFAQTFGLRLRRYHILIYAAVLVLLLRHAYPPNFFLHFTYGVGAYSLFMLVVFPPLLYGWTRFAGGKRT